ncbi:hypothetical protein [Maridesulfovibrio sp.]|uniref:hypothetical protein n=1 Tax=Maridesulfovibrio sp. TaxID=2795000 RepID=UPI0029F541BC|nr:hypothetical protein [Maridesulfovibrio sp.]
MKDKKLDMLDLDQVAGGVVTGTFQGDKFTASANGDGTYTLNIGGQTYKRDKQYITDTMQEMGFSDDVIKQTFADVEDSQVHDYGELT